MANDKEVEFVDGLFVKAPNPKAPDFVKASISIKPVEMLAWLEARKGQEWINLDVKASRGGKWYAAVSTYKPKAKDAKAAGNDTDDEIPF